MATRTVAASRNKSSRRKSDKKERSGFGRVSIVVPDVELTLDWRRALNDLKFAYRLQLAADENEAAKGIAAAEKSAKQAQDALAAIKRGRPKGKGDPRVQAAESTLKRANRHLTHVKSQATSMSAARNALIETQHEQLITAVEAFLWDDVIPDLCGAIKLTTETGNDRLNIYFRLDGLPVVRGQGHGHYSIQQNGDMHYMRMHGAPHGEQHYVVPRMQLPPQ